MNLAEDRLSELLERFPLRAGVFHFGAVCGTLDFDRRIKPGHFHLVRSGRAELRYAGAPSQWIEEPSVVFMPDAESHGLVSEGAIELLCATVHFGSGRMNSVVGSLPPLVVVKLSASPPLEALGDLMFREVRAEQAGRQAVLNRLCELAVVELLRVCLDSGLAHSGTLAALADARLSKAVEVIYKRLDREWSLDELAALAGMSRSRFAQRFREVVGATPGDHIAMCRIAKAQQLLRQGCELKAVAEKVGFASASAFTRAFTRAMGVAPGRWRSSAAAQA